MKQEDKKLHIIDLCARLPYGVKAKRENEIVKIISVNIGEEYVQFIKDCGFMICDESYIEDIKSYLFPMSSMTEEQKEEVLTLTLESTLNNDALKVETIDWLNEHHFDYRGLIDKGLAIDATNLNIYESKN